MKNFVERYSLLYIICAFSLFFTMSVYFKWSNSKLDLFSYFYLIVLVNQLLKSNIHYSNKSLLFPFAFSIFFAWTRLYGNPNIFFLLISASFPFILLIPIQVRKKILDYFLTWVFPILLGISVISYILWSFNLISLPTTYIPALNELKKYDYISHVFFLVPTNLVEMGRFHSYYDEPGVIGTLCGVILFFYGKRLKPWQFFIYFLCGLLSFSFFFFLIFILFLVTARTDRLSNRIGLIGLLFIVTIWIFSWFGEDFIFDSVFSRFLNISNADTNRNHEEFKYYFYNIFIYSDDLWWGTRNSAANSFAAGSYSIQVFIVRYGLVYVIYGLVLYFLLFLKYRVSMKDFFIGLLAWCLFIYQRPSFTDLFYFILFTTQLEVNYIESKITRK